MISVLVHLPVYGVLGVLRDVLAERQAGARGQAPSEIEFTVTDEDESADLVDPESTATKQAAKAKRDDPAKKAPEPKQQEEKKVALPTMPAAPKPPPPAAQKLSQQAIKQKSKDPTAAPPPDTKFIAEENQRVEEETQAAVRSYTQDDPEPVAGATAKSEGENAGNDSQTDIEDARDKQGSTARHVTQDEAKQERPDKAEETPVVAAAGNGREQGAPNGGESASVGTQLPEYETVTVSDGSGTFVVRIPKVRGQTNGAEAKTGLGLGSAGGGTGAGAAARGKHAGEYGFGEGMNPSAPSLRVPFSAFAEAIGQDNLDDMRKQYAEEKRSRLRGGERQRMWKDFRTAIENFVPSVRVGNQTALNAAASPFANYLTDVHLRFHREFADEFLPSLPIMSTSPLANPELVTVLEIILNRNGSVHRVGIVSTSGVLAYDFGAWASVMRAQPYPDAPSAILSGDGRVYFHWGFYRNQRQCGTFNAEPYILPNPPGSPSEGVDPGVGPMPGGILPRDVVPEAQPPSREGRLQLPQGAPAPAPSPAG